MRKMPTLFLRDETDRARVTSEPHPACAWVFAGEGTPTRKYDGTCVLFAEDGTWWARREVKPGKQPPAGFVLVQHDEVTGRSMGWEPVAQSAFARLHTEALATIVDRGPTAVPGATYELLGPKINRNPEGATAHLLVRHGHQSPADEADLRSLPRDFDGIRAWLAARPAWEGVVFHHPDGRRAKIKGRDFPDRA
ncbi:hypothetical protein R8Z50_17145 [Longispora sp. K20-0274]|uniref:hypothetical protein n=1 Tax=Longispora sp. K20-0274 TaxID=3088255 RepID=UPI003999A8C7